MITLENTKTIYDLVKNAKREYGNKIYLRYEKNEVIYEKSYKEFADDCSAFSAWIDEKNSEKGEKVHVSLLGKGSYEYIITLLGTVSAGAVAVPLDAQLDKERLLDCVERSDTDIIFYDWEFNSQIEEVRQKCGKVKEFICLQNITHVKCLEDILNEYSEKDCAAKPLPEECAVIIFTSGTTGRGKGVMLSHANLIDNTFCGIENELNDNEVLLNVLPMHHIFCLNGNVFCSMRYGSTLCLTDSLSKIFYYIDLFKPTVMRSVPMMAKMILNKILMTVKKNPGMSLVEAKESILGKRFYKIISGGGYLSEELSNEYLKMNIQIGQGYGMSECSPRISVAVHERRDKVASVGRIVKRCKVRIVDGEIQVKSPSVMMGYYKEPDKTAEAITEDGYLRTGDLGYVDDENFIYLTGRKKNLIILSNGENVSPEEIEKEFDGETLITDILVYGSDDVIAAEVYPNYEFASLQGITHIEDEIQKIVSNHNKDLPSYKKIAKCTVRKVPFEKTASKKIIRQKFFESKKAEEEAACTFLKPENKVQESIYEGIAEALGHDRFGVDSDIYECGLNSLGSVMLMEQLHNKFQRSVTLNDLMENSTVLKLEEFLNKKEESKLDLSVREVYPLSGMQMYFAYVLKKNTTGNLPFAFKLDNSIDLVRLKKAIEDTIEAHPVLKGRISPDKGVYKMYRDDSRKIDIPIIGISEKEWGIRKKELLEPYSYDAESNLFHINIFQTEISKYLFFDVAHIISDGITMNILLEDINKFYCNEKLEKETYTFYEYVLEEKNRQKLGIREKDKLYIDNLMKDLKMSRSILNKKEKEDIKVGKNAVIKDRFNNTVRNNILYFCKENGISENTMFLTAYNYCISLFSDENDVFCSSIHGGRTNNKWSRLAGCLFTTYYFRFTKVQHERVLDLLHKSSKQIMNTMRCYISINRESEMFFQFQSDILNIDKIGDAKAERVNFQLDSLPFHFQVMYDKKGYYYELRYWENRFDREQIEIFLTCYESILNAMLNESSVRRLKKHVPESVYPKHYYIGVDEINKEAGYEMLKNTKQDQKVKAYILDEEYFKKPYGAWGPLYIMDHKPDYYIDEIKNPYGNGILYKTNVIARILPDKSINFLDNGGRIVLTEGINGRIYYDLRKVEETLCKFNGISNAEAYMEYNPEINEMDLRCDIEADKEVDFEKVKKFLKEECGEKLVPHEINYFGR